METLLQWLPANIPADDGQVSLIHGDYCLSNVMFDPVAARIKAVLDWELSTLGHPFADLAYYCMRLRLPQKDDLKGLAGLDRGALGIPDRGRHYCAILRVAGCGAYRRLAFLPDVQFFPAGLYLPGRL